MVLQCLSFSVANSTVIHTSYIHIDQVDDIYAIRFAQLLKSFVCTQHVSESTHVAGHILDLVISRRDTGIRNLLVGGVLSDHALTFGTVKT